MQFSCNKWIKNENHTLNWLGPHCLFRIWQNDTWPPWVSRHFSP